MENKVNYPAETPSSPSPAPGPGARLAALLGRILAFLAALLLFLPVLLLPLTTAVPAWAWIPLALAGLVLIWLQGGHGLGDENLGQFVDSMVNTILAETYPSK